MDSVTPAAGEAPPRLRVGVAGLGAVAQAVHLPLLTRRYDLFEIGAVADISAGMRRDVGAHYGIAEGSRRYEGVTEMVDGERQAGRRLDGVLLLTSGSHAPAALQAIQAGVPVLCEKPLALSVAEADCLAEAERAAGAPRLLLGYMKEYDDAVQRMARMLATVRGSVRSVDVTVLHPTTRAQLDFANLRPPVSDVPGEVLETLRTDDDAVLDTVLGPGAHPRLRRLYSGVVLGSMVHDVSLLRHLFGGITEVDAADAWPEPQDLPPGDPPSVLVMGRLGCGARVRMAWHYLADHPGYRETVSVHHARGTLELEFGTPYLLNSPTELRVVDAVDGAERRAAYRSVTEAFEHELNAFHAMVTRGEAPRAGVAEGREDIRTCQRIAAALAARWKLSIQGEAARP